MTNDRLIAGRQDKHLSQRALASRVGISPAHYAQLETEDKRPSISVALRIAAALDRSVEFLFGQLSDDSEPTASGQ